MRSPLRILTIALLALTGLSACHRDDGWHLKNVTHVLPDLEFDMQRAGGGAVSAEDFRGKITLLYFGYTHCPDVCPTALARMRAVMKALGTDAKQVQLLFVTVDPDRDSSELLAQYVAAFNPDFVGLRGTPKQTKAFARRYRVSYTKQNVEADGSYAMSHSSAVFVFDRLGNARLLGSETAPVADYVADLQRLIKE